MVDSERFLVQGRGGVRRDILGQVRNTGLHSGAGDLGAGVPGEVLADTVRGGTGSGGEVKLLEIPFLLFSFILT